MNYKHIISFLICAAYFTGRSQECNVIYVTPWGEDTASVGTKAAPASLVHSLTLIGGTVTTIKMSAGTYIISNPINLLNNLTIEGGFNSNNWLKTNSMNTIIYRDNSNVENSPSRLVAIYASSISGFRLQDLNIETSNVFGGGTSTYGLHVDNCSSYNIIRCRIKSGHAGNGINGSNGTNGTSGMDGTNGEIGDENGSCCNLGGIGGSGSFAGSFGGGDGGKGGDRGYYTPPADGDAYNGDPGLVGNGVPAGIGGNGGLKIVTSIYPISCARTSSNDGQPGQPGLNGFDGINGTGGTSTYGALFFTPGGGTLGTNGSHGTGGGGGGGGGSLGGVIHDWPFAGFPSNQNGSGAGGAGGGEGGEAGTGGSGGSGGGGSFGLFITNNGTNTLIQDCDISSGNAGFPGQGGAGGNGGNGGSGGLGGGMANCNIGAGGNGGSGGIGGAGGYGGVGSTGVSENIKILSGSSPLILNINSLQQPFVYVSYSGCTEMPVEFSTDATGSVNWYFGANSSPASASGLSAVSSYTSTGRITFTMVNNGISYTYTGFIDIWNSGAGLNPGINSSDVQICEGVSPAYNSSLTADNYEWVLTYNSVSDTLNGDSLVNFNPNLDSIGDYILTHRSFNNCCGWSFPDTFYTEVLPIIQPSVSIQLSDTAGIICAGETIMASSTYSDAGSSATFDWLLNGSLSGQTGSSYMSNAWANNDQISCVITSSQLCSGGLMDTSNVISVTVVSPPVVLCSVDSSEAGEPSYFSAAVSGGGASPFTYNWNFGDSTSGFGNSVAHMFATPGSYVVNVLVLDSLGCGGSCMTTILVESNLIASFNASSYNGCSPLLIDFDNNSQDAITYRWEFGDGNFSTAYEPTHTYSSPGTYNVSLSAFSGTGSDSMNVSSQVVVYPSPVADFEAFPPQILLDGESVYFGDNSINAWTWLWNFGDPASGASNSSNIQNPTHYYNQNGNYSVSLTVSNQYGCEDVISKSGYVSIEVGISATENSEVTLYPNPMKDNLYINKGNVMVENINIIDICGRSVFNSNITPEKNEKISLDLSHLSEGMYSVIINHKYGSVSTAIIKTR